MIPRKLTVLLAGAALATLGACTSSVENSQPDVQLAAYAASTNYPSVQSEEAHDIGAILEPNSKIIRVLNFGQQAVNSSEVWLNGTFVYKVDTIPGEGYVSLPESNFYDHSGHPFSDTQSTPTKIELRNGDHLWTLMGPIVQ
jgi:hypothetical protein